MAEFVEVIKKKTEMCECFEDCFNCPLKAIGGGYCGYLLNNQPEEAEEIIMNWQPQVDWSNVEVDTPIYVRDFVSEDWLPRYFAKYEKNKVFTWAWGATSFSADNDEDIVSYKYAKLADKEKS